MYAIQQPVHERARRDEVYLFVLAADPAAEEVRATVDRAEPELVVPHPLDHPFRRALYGRAVVDEHFPSLTRRRGQPRQPGESGGLAIAQHGFRHRRRSTIARARAIAARRASGASPATNAMAAASARLRTTPPAHATHPGATMRLPSAVAAANTSAIAAR